MRPVIRGGRVGDDVRLRASVHPLWVWCVWVTSCLPTSGLVVVYFTWDKNRSSHTALYGSSGL